MGRAAGVSVAALLTLAAALGTGEAGDGDGTPLKPLVSAPAASAPAAKTAANPAPAAAPASAPASAPSAPGKRLRLGPYVDPYGPVTADRIFDVPHFETRVEVQGKAMDSAALTARMEWWMRDFEPLRGAVPHQASAPSVQEMAPYRPHVTPGVNIAPIIDWLVDKLNKKD